MRGFYVSIVVLGLFALQLAPPIFAERLPLKLYTSADGLASSAVTHVMKDSRGFLRFSTRDGLSRFDGREFVDYRLSREPAAQTFRTASFFNSLPKQAGTNRLISAIMTKLPPFSGGGSFYFNDGGRNYEYL